MKLSKLTILLLFVLPAQIVLAQEKKISLKDSLDGKMDMSQFLIEANGFLPVPGLITEPALGGFGGSLGLVFLNQHREKMEKQNVRQTPPDITAVLGGYTRNNSWFIGGARIATLPKWRLNYRIVAAYTNVNLDLYAKLPLLGETKIPVQLEMVPVMLSVKHRVYGTNWSFGLNYSFVYSKMVADLAPNKDFFKPIERENTTSSPGAVISFDTRDNIFSPNKGLYLGLETSGNATWLGSDFNNFRTLFKTLSYIPVIKNRWYGSLRAEYINVQGDVPYYFLPSVNLRGVARARYPGRNILTIEKENRVDFNTRWSVVMFGGAAWNYDSWENLELDQTRWNLGTGFRYLMARKFGIRMGVDIAMSEETKAFYIVFGSGWSTN